MQREFQYTLIIFNVISLFFLKTLKLSWDDIFTTQYGMVNLSGIWLGNLFFVIFIRNLFSQFSSLVITTTMIWKGYVKIYFRKSPNWLMNLVFTTFH